MLEKPLEILSTLVPGSLLCNAALCSMCMMESEIVCKSVFLTSCLV